MTWRSEDIQDTCFAKWVYAILVRNITVPCLITIALFSTVEAAEFYVNCSRGDDKNSGGTPANPWKTTTRVNQQVLHPGDAILFKRGAVCRGQRLEPIGNGTAEKPILISDYGTGSLAELVGVGDHEPAILLINVQHYIVRNLRLTQEGQRPQDINITSGNDKSSHKYMRAVLHITAIPHLSTDCRGQHTTHNVILEDLEVYGGSWDGIYASGGYRHDRSACLHDLTIQRVESWGNQRAGIRVSSPDLPGAYGVRDVKVLDSHSHHNGGDGVIVESVENALIDGNECAHNGLLRNARVGCWAWDSRNVTIQFNESHHNVTPLSGPGARDGAGVDLDMGVNGGIMQFNWTHNNEGEGYLVLSAYWPSYEQAVTRDVEVRYNVSESDAKKLAGAITIFGGVENARVYGNSVYYEAQERPADMFGGTGGAIVVDTLPEYGEPIVHFYDNILVVATDSAPEAENNLARLRGNETIRFSNNVWWRTDGLVRWDWGQIIESWSEWQSRGNDRNGIYVDPSTLVR